MDEVTQPLQQFDSQDVEKNKILAIVGYIFPILFFIPLVTDAKNSIYAKFHSNQQLIMLIFCFGGGIALSIITVILAFIPFMGRLMAMLLLPVFWLACLALMIIGIINAANGGAKKLPVIGSIAVLIK
jgi:uncharacterized membrane protein